jgi:hypothetical protein
MPSRAAPWALAAAFLILGAGGAAPVAAPHPGTRIGIFIGGRPNFVAVGRALGVRYERLVMAVNGTNDRQLDSIKAAEDAGFKLNVQFNNLVDNPAPVGSGRARSGPVADDARFEHALGADLDATHPRLVTIQNEEDGLQFWSGTPQDYLHELADAVRVAHVRGYEISNGGITAEGLEMAYWHQLWLSGQHAAADAFARTSLNSAVSNRRPIASDLPDSAHPDRPVLAHIPRMRDKLARVEILIAGYRATGIDYVNFHWYEGTPADLRILATWLSQTTGLPAICNEMGQFSTNPATVDALLGEAQSLHMAWVMWFAIDGKGPAVGLVDPDGAPRANGKAFRAFVTSHR